MSKLSDSRCACGSNCPPFVAVCSELNQLVSELSGFMPKLQNPDEPEEEKVEIQETVANRLLVFGIFVTTSWMPALLLYGLIKRRPVFYRIYFSWMSLLFVHWFLAYAQFLIRDSYPLLGTQIDSYALHQFLIPFPHFVSFGLSALVVLYIPYCSYRCLKKEKRMSSTEEQNVERFEQISLKNEKVVPFPSAPPANFLNRLD
ncbi:hypothetical protein M3Y97_01136000 [Aphelenchoides bicaudatus]|nr:hypothetical protein M3Y97_01136000 [Aphelenchoides bicaudatus]